jgi:hypothetical protein
MGSEWIDDFQTKIKTLARASDFMVMVPYYLFVSLVLPAYPKSGLYWYRWYQYFPITVISKREYTKLLVAGHCIASPLRFLHFVYGLYHS